jgi:hypothetical protein
MNPTGNREQRSEGEVRRGFDERMRDVGGVNAVTLHERNIQIVHPDRNIGDDL